MAPSQTQVGPFISRIQAKDTSDEERKLRRKLLADAYMPFIAVTAYCFKNSGCSSRELLIAGREVVKRAPDTYRRRRDFSAEMAFAISEEFMSMSANCSTSPIVMDQERQVDNRTPLDTILAVARTIRPGAWLEPSS